MRISHEWLRAFVAHDLAPEGVRDLLSAHVATVDRMERLRQDLAPVVVARVLEAERHPNADQLWLTKVDDGSGAILSVVCGAPNVAVGTLYPFARAGSVLPGGVKLEKRKIRGEISNGMLCSAQELGLGDDHLGIMALDVEVAPGTPLLDAVPIGDVQFDVDVLPNRPDLLSHLGMAREVSALTSAPLRDPAELGSRRDDLSSKAARGDREAASGGATVRLEDPEGCPHYMGVVIRGVSVGPSPEWLVRRLESVGVRSVSNVVDATNYFVHGFGQPMHAFDLVRLARSTVVIRRAHAGEPLRTLDGVERTLHPPTTVIADAERAIAVAGVIGGRDSEVSVGTTDLFLEVAYFTPRGVRRTRRALGISTDASYRFERGIDPLLAPKALARAAGLIVQIAGGRVDGAPIDVGAAPSERRPVALRPQRVERLLGDSFSSEQLSSLLVSVGFEVAREPDGRLRARPPSWRHDVAGESDLVEEIARLRGYDMLPDVVQPFRPGTAPDDPLHLLARRVRDALVGAGLVEVRPLPFVHGTDETHVRIRNPVAEDEPHLRASLLETLAPRAEYNLSRMCGDIRIFEIGSAFEPRGAGLPHEELRVGALIMGGCRPPHFTEPRPRSFDAWDAKALGDRLAQLVYPHAGARLVPAEGDALWTVRIGDNGRTVGRVASIPLDAPPWASKAFGVEILLGEMPNAFVAEPGAHAHGGGEAEVSPRTAATYGPLPTTPAADFDLALLLPVGVRAADVERVLRTSAGDLLERLTVFDEYRGKELPPGYRSVAWTLTFRDPARTLREKEIEGRRQRILKSLESELGVRPRTA